MNSLNSKTKTILLLAAFVLFAVGMFFFGYGIMADRNQIVSDDIAKRRVELEILQREQKSFEQGKKDLAQLASSQYPPENLFSKDTRVVNEIQRLEEAAQRYSLDLTIGVTGNTKTAEPVPGTSSGLNAVPYTMTLNGGFGNALLFMQMAERMPFISHAQNLSITVSTGSDTRTVITSEFYLKK